MPRAPFPFSSLLARTLFAMLALSQPVCADDAKVVQIGAEDDAAPWSYADGSGYVNSLVAEALRQSGWRAEYKIVPYARCKRLAEAGELAGCFSMSRPPDPEHLLRFPATPAIEPHFVAYALPDSPMRGCDPKTWRSPPHVGLVNGYEYVHAIEKLKTTGSIQAQVVGSEVAGLNMLAAHRIDVLILTLDEIKREDMLFEQASPQARKIRGTLRRTCDFGGMPAYLAFSSRHPQGAQVQSAFESGMARLRKSGRIKALQREWAERALLLERTKATRQSAERSSTSAAPEK